MPDDEKQEAKDLARTIERADFIYLGYREGKPGPGVLDESERALIIKRLRYSK